MPYVAITDSEFASIDRERAVFAEAGFDVVIAASKSPADVLFAAKNAHGLLVHWAHINRELVIQLSQCRVIVRYGIGFDNIDVDAATEHGIAVCNVPDYALGEVADHTLALALTMARQLPLMDRRTRDGIWKITPDHPLRAFGDTRFVTLGFGRIAREVMQRARGFGFQLAAYDPFVDAAMMSAAGVTKIDLDEALVTADVLSLHLPLGPTTRHLLNADSLRRMKSTAIVINTSRGPLIDTPALVEALRSGALFAAALDVFEREPLPADDPLRDCPRVMLTSHVAWYSDASAPRLQMMAAEEVVRGIRGEPLRSQVNPFSCSASIAKSPS